MSEQTLFCIVLGQTKAFSVDVPLEKSVYELKRRVNRELELETAAVDLVLWHIVGGATKEEVPTASLKELDNEMDNLRTHFPNGALQSRIYIVVQIPPQEEDMKISKIDRALDERFPALFDKLADEIWKASEKTLRFDEKLAELSGRVSADYELLEKTLDDLDAMGIIPKDKNEDDEDEDEEGDDDEAMHL